MKESLRAYCNRIGMESLLAEWDADNAPLSPDDVSYGSKRKALWHCARGHRWTASITERAHGTGCPFCAGKRLAPGENDLCSTDPALAAEWHPTRNGTLRPTDVTRGSGKRVWWRCEKGHAWQAAVSARAKGTGCPVCTGKRVAAGENDFATLFPDLASEWAAENGSLRPDQVRPYSNKKVWWRCAFGHLWQASVNGRVSRYSGCPYCTNRRVLPGFNDLAARFPAVAAQWHPTMNGDLTPDRVLSGSNQKAWWLCPAGHVWQAAIASRTGRKKHGCPVCAGTISRKARVRYERLAAGILPADAPGRGAE